jgi:hypothetical protein
MTQAMVIDFTAVDRLAGRSPSVRARQDRRHAPKGFAAADLGDWAR